MVQLTYAAINRREKREIRAFNQRQALVAALRSVGTDYPPPTVRQLREMPTADRLTYEMAKKNWTKYRVTPDRDKV
jgi:hypothetical protein